jgi:hypothetical protein
MQLNRVDAKSKSGVIGIQPRAVAALPRPALERWVTPQELEALRKSVLNGCLPAGFLNKLTGLATGDLAQRSVEQNCRLFAALLLASEHGPFREASAADRERLLRVLAYVYKEEDAIPDVQAGGFADDQSEVRAVTLELAELLHAFKAWRLRFQVPAMWDDVRGGLAANELCGHR